MTIVGKKSEPLSIDMAHTTMFSLMVKLRRGDARAITLQFSASRIAYLEKCLNAIDRWFPQGPTT